ncbi:MAG TPA: BNR-repeat neuraminidase N-terminal domain-containing protein [Saprospiraceae bacterium]|nr:BNR-repeat neuraminidase N-terminal domain-containing protein [Saprospiraceae bacterium]
MMKNLRVFLFIFSLCSAFIANSQISVTATAGDMGPTAYTTISAAFTAINAGTHQGDILISVTGNTTEAATPTALLKSSSPSSYSSVIIRPTGGNWIINSAAAPTASRGIIELNGADNVTIDGDDPSTPGERNLTIQSVTATTTGIACVRLSSNSTTGTDGADNNTVKNCIIVGSRSSATSSTVNYGIVLSNSTSISTGAYSSINTKVENNVITRCWHGIYVNGESTTYPNTGTQILRNKIGTPENGIFDDATTVGFRGIYIDYSAVSGTGALIQGNDIRVGVSTTGYSNTIAGIEVQTANFGITIDRNNIHDINQPSTGGWGAHGIYVTGSANNTSSTITNNFIRDCKMVVYQTSATSTFIPCGLFFTAGATNVNFINNTVVMNTQLGSGTNFSSFCVNSSVSGVTFSKFNNNILVNNATSTSAYCFYVNNTASISSANVNNNNYYSSGGNIGYYNGSARTSLTNWQSATTKDNLSFNSNPSFVTSTDLHLNYGSLTSLFESTGAPVGTTNVTSDFDGDTRPGPTGSINGGGTNPDMGADEFDGVPPVSMMYISSTVDQLTGSAYAGGINQPIIRINVVTSGPIIPLNLTSITVNANGTTDIADINSATAKVYYTGPSTTFSTATLFGSGTPTIADFAVTGSQLLAEGNNYFWLAYDVAPGASTGNNIDGECNSVTLGGTFTPTVTAPTGNKTILGPLNGTYLVGTGQTSPNFATLTEAINDLNGRGVSGPVIFNQLDANYSGSEVFPLTINQVAGATATNTVTFKPMTTSTISGSVASGALIKLNGADYVTFDGSNSGGADRSLTIVNSSITAPTVISVASLGTGLGSNNNTIKNCNLSTGVAASLGYGISIGGNTPGTAGDDNDNTTIQNNSISIAPIGIYATASATGVNDNLNIIGNTVTYNGALASIGIQVGQANNCLISQNTVDEQTSASQSPTAISLETGFLNSSVTRNNITHALTTATGGYGGRGITVGTGSASSNLTIANNFISGINGSNWTGFSNSSSMGIGIGMIGNSSTITTISGGINIYHNSVNLYGDYQGTSTTTNKITTALYVGSGATALDVKNNIFANSINNPNAVAAAYAIYSAAANTAFTAIDYNDYYVSGAQGVLGFIGSNRTDLAGIIAGFGQNSSSTNSDPKFISNSDLHINTSLTTIVEGKGTPLASVTTDIDNETRNALTPDLGADEGNFIAILGNDVQATAFDDPINGGSKPTGIAFTPMASFTNNGTNTQTNIPVRYRVLNSSMVEIYNEIGTIASLVSGASFTHTFPPLTLTTGGTYTIFAKAELVGDELTSNDEITGTLIGDVPLCGTYAVGSSQPVGFQNLTQAFSKINALGVSCAVVFELQSDYTSVGETLPLTLSNIPGISSANTFTLKPASGVNSTISGSINSNVIIKVLSDYVTIDGSNNNTTSRNLNITNTGTTGPSVVLIGSIGTAPRINVTLKNCNITNGLNTSTAVAVTDATVLGNDGYFNNITVQNNNIKKAYIGIYSRAAVSSGNGSGLNINNNDLTTSGSDAIRFTGIYLQGVDGGSVSNNLIGNFDTTSDEDDNGIYLATGVKNISVLSNKISNLGYTGINGYGAHGILVASGVLSANILVANNMISNMFGDGWSYTAVAADNPIGIALTSTQDGISIYHNTISLSGNTLNQTGAMSMGILLNTGSVADIRNNIIVNNLGLTGAIGYGSVGIYAATANTQFTDINYNNYVCNPTGSGLKYTGQILTTGSTLLSDWQTATTKDANSVSINPVFTSATDLHLIPESNITLNNLGTPVALVTTDFDNETRNLTTPDIGCDEYTPIVCVGQPNAGTVSPATISICNGLATIISATGISSGSGISYQWKSGPSGGPYTNVSGGTGATTSSYTTPSLETGNYYYVLETLCSNSGQTNITNEVAVGVTGDEVTNENNDGAGSLRKAIECTAAGDTVFVSSGSVNLINLLTQLNVDKPLLILDDNGSPVMLKFDFGGVGLMNETNGAFKVGTMGNVTLDNIHIKHVGNDATHPIVKNEGILTLKNSKITGETGNIIPPVVQNATGATINAEGTSEIKSE